MILKDDEDEVNRVGKTIAGMHNKTRTGTRDMEHGYEVTLLTQKRRGGST